MLSCFGGLSQFEVGFMAGPRPLHSDAIDALTERRRGPKPWTYMYLGWALGHAP